jgi:post-segregation antitoxin CcdA
MVRRKVTLRLNDEVVQKAKDAGMNLSYFLEVKLVEYLFMLQAPRERFELSLPRKGTGSQGRRGRPDFATSA